MKITKFMVAIMMLIMIPTVMAVYSFNSYTPAPYSIQNGTTVTIGANVTKSDATPTTLNFNCSIYTKMARGDNYTFNTSFWGLNDSLVTTTIAFNDADRVWYKIGCWDKQLNTSVDMESITMPTNLSALDFTYDTNGVGSGVNGLIGWVNETVDAVNESISNLILNDSSGNNSIALVGNGSIQSVTSAIASWNLSAGNTTMVAGTDYTLSLGVVYINSSTYQGNTTYWTYTYYNNSLLVEDTDYTISGGVIYANYTARNYVGDTAKWNYSYPYDPNVNEVMTAQRIFDVDDYYDAYIALWMPLRLFRSTAVGVCDSSSEGTIFYNSTANKINLCTGSAWETVTSS